MKRSLIYMLAGLLAISLTAGCKSEAPKTAEKAAPAAPAAPLTAAPAAPQAAGKTGSVLETMNSGGYTYIQVDTGTEKLWAAAPEFKVAVGDPVVVPEGMAMANYTSPTLNRTFDSIYFVPSVMVPGAMGDLSGAGAAPEAHPAIETPAAAVDLSGIEKAEGGNTVEEIFTGAAELAGQNVVIRGKVVKFSAEIMGKNWIHLQDGTGAAGTNDLTVTTSGTAAVGDTVKIAGVVTVDKDFGYGYKYDVIVEDAEVTVE